MKQTVRAGVKEVALTFDDGPSQWTPQILSLLAHHNAKATFFVLGAHVVEQPSVLERIIREGHEVGVHGWDHKPVDELSAQQVTDQLANTCEQISKHGDTVLRWWRPPWHRTTPAALEAAEQLGLSYCGVTVDTYDVNRSDDQIVSVVYRDVKAGAIVGMHDGIASNGNHETPHRENIVRAVHRVLSTMTKPWRFVTVSELLG